MIQKCFQIISRKPLFRGMVVYAITWPTGSLIQQSFESDTYNYKRVLNFGLYGTFFVAPTLYGWMTIAFLIWPKTNLKYSLIKVGVEQMTYGPCAIFCYYFGMTVLDGGSINDGLKEVSEKFFPTWKIGCIVWPTVQTVNYYVIPERNRLPFVSFCSFLWTIFLAFKKYKSGDNSQVVNTQVTD